jgi:hypothetical protein|tara:strand:+ start:7441 stop:7704 length:264 start_codon:yes stop_codon:yes gene_type:complete
MPKKKEETTPKEQEAIDRYVEAVDLFQRDPTELVEDPAAIDKIVAYLRTTRTNVAAAEKAGKRINKKSANSLTSDDKPSNPLDALAS